MQAAVMITWLPYAIRLLWELLSASIEEEETLHYGAQIQVDPNPAAHQPFDFTQHKPFDFAQDKPFDFAQDKPRLAAFCSGRDLSQCQSRLGGGQCHQPAWLRRIFQEHSKWSKGRLA